MRSFIAFALLIAGISALPQQSEEVTLHDQRIVTDAIASAIEDISTSIKDAGLDPFYIQHDADSYALPVPIIFNAAGVVEEFMFRGLSEIVINSMSFGLISNRLRLDISLPLVEVSSRKADGYIVLFGEKYSAETSGRLQIRNLNVNVDINVNVGIISGISIRSIDLNIKIAAIDSRLTVNVAGHNLSERINTFLGKTIPDTLDEFQNEVNELFEIIGLDYLNNNLFG